MLRKDAVVAMAGMVAAFKGAVGMDLSADMWRIMAEESAKRCVDGRCLYCRGFNHRAVEYMVRKKAQTIKVAAVEVKEIVSSSGSEELGKH